MTNSPRKILITGGNGQVANALRHHARAREFALTLLSRAEMDITHSDSIAHALQQYQPDIVINTAAYTAVDKAETEQESALEINHLGAANVAKMCQQHQIPLIHLSTDYVFDGSKNAPYLEDDSVNPINFYGHSKLLGEQAVRENCHQHIILRVSGVFGDYGNNFKKTMLRLAAERKELRIVADQLTCPTNANDIAGALLTLAGKLSHYGTYHYCSTPVTSWHAFANAVIAEARERGTLLLVENIAAITAAEYPTPAKRPAYSAFDCSKILRDYGIQQPSWK